MKPAVINSSSETPTQTHHEPNVNSNNQPNNGQSSNDHSRRFPQFRHGFGFDGPDGDVFADMGLRSRLNRMGNPFDWSARKRRGSGQGNAADPYDHYFDDVDFPHFGSTWDAFGRMGKRSQQPHETNDRSGFFDYIPPEFRHHVPEHFGGYFRQHGAQPYHQQQPQQQQPPPQPQQQPAHQQTQPPISQPSGSKSNLCDAAIQTDDLNVQNNGERKDAAQNVEHDNRNGMNQNAGASANPMYGAPQQGQAYGRPQPYGPKQNQFYANPPPHHQQQQQQQPPKASSPPQHQPKQRPPQPEASQEGHVRTVPIVFEDGTPISRTEANCATSQTPPSKPRPEPLNKDSFASNQPIPSDQPIPCPAPASNNQQQSDQHHSENSNAESAPPQTPHTADCISRIQAIQRDVLELMLAVEQFGGKRGDKDYIYLDEMLTRNLLKLDTIDTNGKESIRLARKEAIKCIQTSIAVLEAKADLHLNEKRDSISQAAERNSDQVSATGAVDESSDEAKTATEQCLAAANAVDIPKVENISITDERSNDTEETSRSGQTNEANDKRTNEKTLESPETNV